MIRRCAGDVVSEVGWGPWESERDNTSPRLHSYILINTVICRPASPVSHTDVGEAGTAGEGTRQVGTVRDTGEFKGIKQVEQDEGDREK